MRLCLSSAGRISFSQRIFGADLALFGAILLLAAFVTPCFAGDVTAAPADRFDRHPVLTSFGLSAENLPAELFLVRTRGELPRATGVVVHASRGGLYLVSGDPDAVFSLADEGCAVFPLPRTTAAPRSPGRVWARLDTPDPDIAAMVAEVAWTGVSAKIQWLADFGTRYSYATNHYTVADAIGDVLTSYGLNVVLRSFVYNTRTLWNVEATQLGTVYPDSFVVICGHFDSTSRQPSVSAPGADDNGSGVAAVLTAAEILTQHEFEYSIRYICFAGEEQGLVGSEDYAAWAAAQNLGIVGVLNFDMMGYWEDGVPKDLEIETNVASQWLAAAIVNAANLYTTAPYELHVYDGAYWGDHASFWAQGYAAVNHEEAWDWYDPDFNPYYHTINDLLVYVDPDFTVGNIRVGVASLATLAGYVPEGTGIGDPATPVFAGGTLRAYPNPFDSRVAFSVSGLGDRANVSIAVFDALGRRVAELPVALENGGGTAIWQAADEAALEIGAGVYFARLQGIRGARPVKIVRVK
jgi:aminopeptidase YwaD